MNDLDPSIAYTENTAPYYDKLTGSAAPAEGIVEFIHHYAGSGIALEFGIGMGRIAIRLARKGTSVVGVDVSAAMLKRLAADIDDSIAVEAINANMVDLRLSRHFDVVYCVFNAIFLLLKQEEQTKCFATAREHLKQDGRFIIETAIPGLDSLINDRLVGVDGTAADWVRLIVTEHEPATQHLTMTTLLCEDGQPNRVMPSKVRYASPAELDLMATLAGLELENRWGGWYGEPFTGRGNVVSVYRRVHTW